MTTMVAGRRLRVSLIAGCGLALLLCWRGVQAAPEDASEAELGCVCFEDPASGAVVEAAVSQAAGCGVISALGADVL